MPVGAWLLVIVAVPNILLALYSLWRSDGGLVVHDWTLDNFTQVLGSELYRALIFKTLYTALGAACVATLIAYPMAYYVSRRLNRARMTAVMLVLVPLWVSLLVRIFGWKIILGENGALNSALMRLGVIDEPSSAFLYTRGSVFITMIYVAIPFIFVASYTALERVPSSLIEASHDAGASRWATFRNVVWPLSRQGAAIGFALASLIALGDYLTPALVGGLNGTMLGSVIASQFGLAGNWPLGAAMAIVLLAVVGLLLIVVALLGRTRGVIESSGPAAPATRPRRTVGSVAAGTLFGLPYLFLYAPLLAIALFSFNDSTVQAFPIQGLTTRWYEALAQDQAIIDALQRSLLVSFGAVAIAAVVGTAFAFVFTANPSRLSRLMQTSMAIPVLLPGVVLGLSMAITFRAAGMSPGLLNVLIGHASFVTPVVMIVVYSRLKQLDPSFAHASMDLGANRLKTFWHVVLPLLRTALIGGCLLGFTLSFDEIIVTFFLTGNEPTLPVYVWNQLRFGFTPSVNAIFTCIALVSLVVIVTATRVMRRGTAGSRDEAVVPVLP